MQYEELTDAELIARCRQGHEAAWSTLVRRYQRLIFTVPRRAGLSAEEAADVFQSCFEKLYRHIDRIADAERVRAWLVTTARRETLRLLEQARRVVDLAPAGHDDDDDKGDPLDRFADPQPLAETLLADLQEQDRVRRAMERLDARSRQLLELLFLQDDALPYAEIAARLGIAEGSIGPLRARALGQSARAAEKYVTPVFSARVLCRCALLESRNMTTPVDPDDTALEHRLRASRQLEDAPEAVIQRATALWQRPARPASAGSAAEAPGLLPRLIAALGFDSSAASPTALGVRAAGAATRQLLYNVEGHGIDLRIAAAGDQWAFSGQVLGPDSYGSAVLADAQGQAVGEAPLDELGEFRLPAVAAGRYTLTFRLRSVEIVLPPIDVPQAA